jgi:AcrR family transcriptional regulator
MAATVGRGALREEAILRATLDLLAESGYDQLTIDAVAARARCSKATIYRRWQGKAVLVTTAVRRYAGQPGTAAFDAGSLRLDLLASLQAMRSSLLGQDAALILGLLVAMRRDPELASAVRDQVLAAKREAFGTAIARAIARGDIPATTDTALLAEICSAVLLSRLLVTGEPLDDAFVEHLVDGVLLPVLRPPPKPTTGELPECGRRSFSAFWVACWRRTASRTSRAASRNGDTPADSVTGRCRTSSRAGRHWSWRGCSSILPTSAGTQAGLSAQPRSEPC